MKRVFISWLFLFGCINLKAQQEQVNKTRVAEYFQNEQFKEAIDYLLPTVQNDLQDIYTLNALGYAYLMNEETSNAEFFFKKIYSIDSTNFTANKYLAQIEKDRDNFISALEYHERMIRTQPRNASLFKSTGDLCLLLKRKDSALVYYAQSYLLQPYNFKYASAYVNQLLNQKSYGIADSILTIFLSIDSVHVPAMMLAIRSAYEQDNYKSAVAFSNRWLNINGDDNNLSTTLRLAVANYELKNFLVSYKLCDTLMKQDLLDENLFYHAARALNKLGRYKESNHFYTECLDQAISKNAEKYFFGKAENFESMRQYKSAIASSDTAYYLFQNPLALYNMGRLYETGLKNKTKALSFYNQYLKKATPSTAQEKKAYAYLKELLEGKKETK
jgi:tetratricopeptide (TPR) repeat protein